MGTGTIHDDYYGVERECKCNRSSDIYAEECVFRKGSRVLRYVFVQKNFSRMLSDCKCFDGYGTWDKFNNSQPVHTIRANGKRDRAQELKCDGATKVQVYQKNGFGIKKTKLNGNTVVVIYRISRRGMFEHSQHTLLCDT